VSEEKRIECRVGVTEKVTARAAQNLYVLCHSETWPDLLDVLEAACIEIETRLINFDPADKAKVLEHHKFSKAAWVIFETMQDRIIAASHTYLSSLPPQPVSPSMTEEERERENILNPTFPQAIDDGDGLDRSYEQ